MEFKFSWTPIKRVSWYNINRKQKQQTHSSGPISQQGLGDKKICKAFMGQQQNGSQTDQLPAQLVEQKCHIVILRHAHHHSNVNVLDHLKILNGFHVKYIALVNHPCTILQVIRAWLTVWRTSWSRRWSWRKSPLAIAATSFWTVIPKRPSVFASFLSREVLLHPRV